MASLRQIRSRLRTIQSTKQIMRAMQLVSASKFKRAQGRLLQGRQMLGFLDELLQRVLAAAPDLSHPLTQARADAPEALLVVTSDTGLAGSYNTNLVQLTEAELRKDMAQRLQLSFIGKRGHRYFTRRGYAAKDAYLDFAGRPNIAKIDAIGKVLLDRFLAGEVSAVRLLYAKFASTSVSRPVIKSWLPIALPSSLEPSASSQVADEYIFEPSAQRVFEDLLPRWAIATFRLSLLEAFTSEHGARMIAMKNATDNAEELLGDLTRQRNRVRQASITKELSEIVGTAEALK
ncbi:MAG: ATP synthase F1 subunit gamma [Candidatus Omnitrophica bacterium CG11_big_fil_rev_8_21_14_0_20_63_9]|nr:MAG: ATP synthase F1 subunit gamma [Candidatus Omnitrophica bacterium CG11_big_fil_rev_8_21_14_0_20_63_9]